MVALILTCGLSQSAPLACNKVSLQQKVKKLIPRQIPVLGFKKQVLFALHQEMERRKEDPSFRNTENHLLLEMQKATLINLTTLNLLGVPLYPPNILRASLRKLSHAELLGLAIKGEDLPLKDLARVLGSEVIYVTLSTSLIQFVMAATIIVPLVQHKDDIPLLINMAISRFSSHSELQKVQDKELPLETAKRKAFERWQEAFKMDKGRLPDPNTFPEDREEWEFQMNLILKSSKKELMIQYNLPNP